jgi:hypothetical protein
MAVPMSVVLAEGGLPVDGVGQGAAMLVERI